MSQDINETATTGDTIRNDTGGTFGPGQEEMLGQVVVGAARLLLLTLYGVLGVDDVDFLSRRRARATGMAATVASFYTMKCNCR